MFWGWGMEESIMSYPCFCIDMVRMCVHIAQWFLFDGNHTKITPENIKFAFLFYAAYNEAVCVNCLQPSGCRQWKGRIYIYAVAKDIGSMPFDDYLYDWILLSQAPYSDPVHKSISGAYRCSVSECVI